jgi:hypothetical protein
LAVGGRGTKRFFAMTPRQANSSKATLVKQPARFNCLPKDLSPKEVVSYRGRGKDVVNVEKTLVKMNAKCRQGKLFDSKRQEIRFFRPQCWGKPPTDYLEIQQRENEELKKLRNLYTVIVFACNPMIQ